MFRKYKHVVLMELWQTSNWSEHQVTLWFVMQYLQSSTNSWVGAARWRESCSARWSQ